MSKLETIIQLIKLIFGLGFLYIGIRILQELIRLGS